MSVDRGWVKILNPDNELRRSLAFCGSPWKVEVERVKGKKSPHPKNQQNQQLSKMTA